MNVCFLQIEVCNIWSELFPIRLFQHKKTECWLSVELHYQSITARFNEPEWPLTGTCECGGLKKRKGKWDNTQGQLYWSGKNHLEPEIKMALVTCACARARVRARASWSSMSSPQSSTRYKSWYSTYALDADWRYAAIQLLFITFKREHLICPDRLSQQDLSRCSAPGRTAFQKITFSVGSR